MKHYLNLSGRSNVTRYSISDDSITVEFASGAQRTYLYNYLRPGPAMVEKMKTLAENGIGLNSYISTVVKKQYADKW